jgi:hypothetical protein
VFQNSECRSEFSWRWSFHLVHCSVAKGAMGLEQVDVSGAEDCTEFSDLLPQIDAFAATIAADCLNYGADADRRQRKSAAAEALQCLSVELADFGRQAVHGR